MLDRRGQRPGVRAAHGGLWLVTGALLVGLQQMAPPAGASPQLGLTSFAIETDAGWSDDAFGRPEPARGLAPRPESEPILSEAVQEWLEQAGVGEVDGDGEEDGDAPAGGLKELLSGISRDLLLVSPMQGPNPLSATCIPDPVTICREILLEPLTRTDAAVAARGGALLPIAAGASLLVGLVALATFIGRRRLAARRLAAG